MWHLLLAVMLALTALSGASIKCPDSGLCPCSLQGHKADILCHHPMEDRSHFLMVKVEERRKMTFQCDFNMLFSEFNFLSGMKVGPIDFVEMMFCPMPNAPFQKFFQSFNVTGVTQLSFHHSNLTDTLVRSQFSGLVNLTSLAINSCSLTSLPHNIFHDLTNLVYLDLRENSVQLPAHVFDHLANLQRLELGRNNITHLEHGIFRNLTNLKNLHLWGNRLQNLSREVFVGLSNLEILELSSNGILSLPSDVFAEMPKINELSLYGNRFISLPDGLFSNMPLLRKLKLFDNREQLEYIPPGFLSNLTQLQEVDLNKCELTNLPEDLFWGSPEIRSVSLQNNAFRTLPAQLFRDSRKIVSLDLGYNQLEKLPDELFSNLVNLVNLTLGHNKLTNISKNLFKDTRELLRLDLEDNNLQMIEWPAFENLGNLVHLKMSHNQLTLGNNLFPQSLLSSCVNLQELYLSYNNISTIFNDLVINLSRLRIIDLSHNVISNLHTTDLHFLSTTVTVDLTYNNISVMNIHDNVPADYYVNKKNAKDIQRKFLLEGNPIMCDCMVYDLLLYIEGKQEPGVYNLYQLEPGNLTCAGPPFLKGVPLSKLSSQSLECALPNKNMCPEPCTCAMRPADTALRIHCSHMNMTVIPTLPRLDSIKNNVLYLLHMKLDHTELLFSNNKITKLPTMNNNPGYKNVTKMYLSNNNISTISTENLPPIIQYLELHNNSLTHLNESVLNKFAANTTRLIHLTLHNNPWECDCNARGLLTFLQEHFKMVSRLSDITCDGSRRALNNVTITELCPNSNVIIIATSITIALLGIIVGIIAALYYYYHREVKVWLFARGWCLWFVTEEELDREKLYDAFISYSHRDEDFVVNKLVPELEAGPSPFKLCLHYRDWIAGEWIPNQIARSVEDSRRTLVVLSPNFLESVWGRMEFRTAHSQALSEGRARVIVLLYGEVGPLDQLDPELKAYLSMNTYVKWGDPWFWDKLRYALPHPQTSGKKRGMELKPCKMTVDDKLELINPSTPPVATTPPTETLKNPLEAAKDNVISATNGHATLIAESNGYVNQCFVKSV